MSADLHALYQQVILDHSRSPQNCRVMSEGRKAEGDNPICGDRVTVYIRIDEDVIRDVSIQSSGCAIVKASASLMTESVKGQTIAGVDALIDRFERMITAPFGAPVEDLGQVGALAGVRIFPTRIKCASLPWHALRAAVEARPEPVSTE
jgi:nitrogen fixation NifU-like protein